MNIFANHAQNYWLSGLPVIPCKGKRPILERWQQYGEHMPTAEEQEEWLRRYPKHNIGLPLGPCSGLVAVDIDTDDPQEIAAIRSVLPDTPCIRVGKKGMVLFYRWSGQKNFKVKTVDKRQPVEFLSKGNQVIVAPSIHPDTNQPYTANVDLWEVLDDVPALPDDFSKTMLEHALGIKKRRSVACAAVKPGARHNTLISFAGKLTNQGNKGEALAAKLQKLNATFDPPMLDGEVNEIIKWAESLECQTDFVRDDSGKIVAKSQANIRAAISQLGIELCYDEFAGKYLIEGLPGHGGFLDDAAVRRAWFSIQEHFGFQSPKDFFWECVLDLAQQNAVDPVCSELDRLQLEWDGVQRIDGWLSRYGGAKDTPYTRAIGRKWLIALIRRPRQPGVKFDTILVLVSPQGTNKSTVCELLAGGPKRFSDHIPFNADGREAIESLSGRWIVEGGELHGLRNASAEKLKSFLSRTVDRGRAAFARATQDVPRRCIFIGSTNAATFLTDGTGNRRFWPVNIENFDLEAFARDRDQLIGEAATVEATGESLILPEELWEAAAVEQDNRRVENPIVSALESALAGQTGRIRSTDVWEILKIPTAQQYAMAGVVSNAMQELGWVGGKHRFGAKNPERGYIKGEELERQVILTVTITGLILQQSQRSENRT